MEVYWTITILTVLINLYPIKEQKQYSIRLIVSLIPLFLYGAFRVNYGLDYKTYEDFYNGIKTFGHESNERMEIGYYYLNKILPTFRSVLIVQTLLLCTAYYYLFKWYIPSKWAWFGFSLLFLNGPLTIFFMLSGIRNGMAVSIFILSTYFIQKRKIIPFAILILMAYLFHNSIVLYAPIAYLVANGKPITKRSMIVWLSIMLIFAFASTSSILDQVNIFIRTYFDRYSYYITHAMEQGQGKGVLATIFSLLVSTILLLLFKNKKLTTTENMFIKLTLLYFLSYLLGSLNIRMSQYFASFFIVGSTLIVYLRLNKILKQFYLVAIFVYLIYALMIWFKNPYYSYSTYQSIF